MTTEYNFYSNEFQRMSRVCTLYIFGHCQGKCRFVWSKSKCALKFSFYELNTKYYVGSYTLSQRKNVVGPTTTKATTMLRHKIQIHKQWQEKLRNATIQQWWAWNIQLDGCSIVFVRRLVVWSCGRWSLSLLFFCSFITISLDHSFDTFN